MKLIVFDIDGTLTDTKRVEDVCFFRAFKASFGLDISEMDWDDFEHVTDQSITKEIIQRLQNRTPEYDEVNRMKENFIKALSEELDRDSSQFDEIPGALSFFELLASRADVALGVATGSWAASGRLKLEAIGIDIEGVPFSNSDRFYTRQEICRDVFEQAEAKRNQPFDEVIYFGDGVWDLHTCADLGVRFIGIDVLEDGKLTSHGASEVLPDYSHPADLLKRLGLSVE